MKAVRVEVIGPEPACVRCQTVKKIVEEAAAKLRQSGTSVAVERVNIAAKETVQRYGVLLSPAIAVNGTVKIMGRVPGEKEVEKLIKEAST